MTVMHRRVSDFLAYRWRYVIGYSFIIIVIVASLLMAAVMIPHELRQAEIDTALTSSSLGTSSMSPWAVIDLPYHLLQKVSFMLFGVTTLTIKLPSIILGTLTALGIFLLIRTWFSAGVAILSTLLTVVTTQFLFISQDGTPLIMHAFLSIWLLFVATFVTRRKYFGLLWKVLTCLALAASLYTPLGIYLALVMLTSSLLHPHIRFLIKKMNKKKVVAAVTIGIAALVPLAYAIYLDTDIAATLLGIPSGPVDFRANALAVLNDAFGFASLNEGYIARPLYPIGMLILMLIGLYRILTHRYTARSYITLAWGSLMLLLVTLNPSMVIKLYPVSVILVSYGIIYMIRSWYKIFPNNPYARVAGMVPLTVLVIAMVLSGATRYVGAYRYDPAILSGYTNDLVLLNKAMVKYPSPTGKTLLVTTPQQTAFYQLVAKYNTKLQVTDNPSARGDLTIISGDIARTTVIPNDIIVSARQSNSDRFYVYKK